MKSGLHIATAQSFGKEWQQAARDLGYSDTAVVTDVVAGSAAARAGIKEGDRLLSYNDTAIPQGVEAVPAFVKAANSLRESRSTVVEATLHRDEATLNLVIPMDSVCAFTAEVYSSTELNALADGKTVYVSSAMLRFAASDDELSTVVAHEIAHNAMRHMEAKRRNAGLASLLGAALNVASATQGVNTYGRYTNQFAALGAQKFSQSFENEADYVGMYILALAGRPLENVRMFWRRMAQENPGSIKFATSHPTTAERYVRLEAAAKEIESKKANGEVLRPEMKVKGQ